MNSSIYKKLLIKKGLGWGIPDEMISSVKAAQRSK